MACHYLMIRQKKALKVAWDYNYFFHEALHIYYRLR